MVALFFLFLVVSCGAVCGHRITAEEPKDSPFRRAYRYLMVAGISGLTISMAVYIAMSV